MFLQSMQFVWTCIDNLFKNSIEHVFQTMNQAILVFSDSPFNPSRKKHMTNYANIASVILVVFGQATRSNNVSTGDLILLSVHCEFIYQRSAPHSGNLRDSVSLEARTFSFSLEVRTRCNLCSKVRTLCNLCSRSEIYGLKPRSCVDCTCSGWEWCGTFHPRRLQRLCFFSAQIWRSIGSQILIIFL